MYESTQQSQRHVCLDNVDETGAGMGVEAWSLTNKAGHNAAIDGVGRKPIVLGLGCTHFLSSILMPHPETMNTSK
jgi:hypothetical protein